MSSTKPRIISALVLMLIVGLCLYLGPVVSSFLVIIFGMFVIDELLVNFFKKERLKFDYFIAFILYFFSLFIFYRYPISNLYLYLNLVLNFFLLLFLFIKKFRFSILSKHRYLGGFLVVLPILSLIQILSLNPWPIFIIGLICVTTISDAGAWFFGKNYGKTALWKAVSPNKTIEGAASGIFLTIILMSLFWFTLLDKFSWWYILIFALWSILGILGDLIQSKFKRKYKIKDSSSLIPGHGGFFDRGDSILFLAPFYLILLRLM